MKANINAAAKAQVKGFTFSDYKREIPIDGKRFSIDISAESGDVLNGENEKIRAAIEAEKKKGTVNTDAGRKRIADVYDAAIDTMLGKDASKSIFDGRAMSVSERQDVFLYITTFMAAEQQKHKASIRGMASGYTPKNAITVLKNARGE